MSDLKDRYEEVQRYHVYNVGGEDTYCRDEDVAELEAKYAKLAEAHDIALQALGYIAKFHDDNIEALDALESYAGYEAEFDAYAMKDEAATALEKIEKVMP